ncbi:MAG: hypothetical protein EOP84_20300 [Verrucomicrobiaceae bacterium]|nr:MAG: hypothetical protein EOP84_20300 [Verrucomicrobiaceae bacterium]
MPLHATAFNLLKYIRMKLNSKSLLLELERELDQVHIEHNEPKRYCEHALGMLLGKIERLENYLTSQPFGNQKEAADFLETVKPQFAKWLLYYQEVYRIELHNPGGSEKILRNYYKSALGKLKTFPGGNLDFYHYCRMKDAYPEKYIPGDEQETTQFKATFEDQSARQFLTPEDFKDARITSDNLISLYLEYELAKLDAGTLPGPLSGNIQPGKENGNDSS